MSITVLINEQKTQLSRTCDLADCIRQYLQAPPMQPLSEFGVALAVNGVVVPQQQWPKHHLSEGDRIALFRAIAGG